MVGIRNKKRMIEILDLIKIEDFEIEKLELRHDRLNNWDRCFFEIKSIPNWKFSVQLIGDNKEDCFGDYEPFIDKFRELGKEPSLFQWGDEFSALTMCNIYVSCLI